VGSALAYNLSSSGDVLLGSASEGSVEISTTTQAGGVGRSLLFLGIDARTARSIRPVLRTFSSRSLKSGRSALAPS
jgi:hypothetical protein